MDFMESQDADVLIVNHEARELAGTADSRGRLRAEVGDARGLAYADHSFDLVHSNSVIEHVGSFADKCAFASEVRRLAPAYYVQTPYYWFPIDPHWPKMPLFHWMPLSWRWRLLCRFKLGFAGPHREVGHAMADLEATVLLDWAQMRSLFPDARLRPERLFGLPKSIIAERTSSRALDREEGAL